LTINDQPVRTDSENGALRGGSLGAQFAIRDELGIAAQTEIDAFARDLVGRFADPAVDTTLAPGDAGLFTDTGLAFNPADEVGLSSRLTVNAAIDPAQGGDAWRIRDGMNALTEGPVGDATLIQNLSNALTGARATVSGGFAGSTLSAAGLVSAMISDVGATVIGAEQEVSFTSARLTVLTQEQLAQGVDTDQELQNLLLVEQSYAANQLRYRHLGGVKFHLSDASRIAEFQRSGGAYLGHADHSRHDNLRNPFFRDCPRGAQNP